MSIETGNCRLATGQAAEPSPLVIPAKAGISGPEVTALLHETPACAGVTLRRFAIEWSGSRIPAMLTLRKAQIEDAEILFSWRNSAPSPSTRQGSGARP